jgi:hypothetical protein
MGSPRKLHAFLILITVLMLGVATVGFVFRPRTRAGESAAPQSPLPPASEASATVLDSGGLAAKPPASPGDVPAKERARPAAVVVPPALALKFEKRYRGMSPNDMELACQQLGTKLRVEIRHGASEESLHELRCEVAWLTERRPRKE